MNVTLVFKLNITSHRWRRLQCQRYPLPTTHPPTTYKIRNSQGRKWVNIIKFLPQNWKFWDNQLVEATDIHSTFPLLTWHHKQPLQRMDSSESEIRSNTSIFSVSHFEIERTTSVVDVADTDQLVEWWC